MISTGCTSNHHNYVLESLELGCLLLLSSCVIFVFVLHCILLSNFVSSCSNFYKQGNHVAAINAFTAAIVLNGTDPSYPFSEAIDNI